MQIKEYLRRKLLGLLGLAKTDGESVEQRLTFINDAEKLIKSRIIEYNVWYGGDGDELLNFYTHEQMLSYNYEPWYSRNKRNYFWSISSTEQDIKRTHSGQARNMVDTIVGITSFPTIKCTNSKEMKELLAKIIEDSKLKVTYRDEQLPLTLVEGWGCYKINWNLDISDYPYAEYYRAENVDFIYKANRIVGIIFKDYYTDGENKKYMLTETRMLKYDNVLKQRYLEITKELFKTMGDEIVPVEDFNAVPELAGCEKAYRIDGISCLLAEPCILFKDTSGIGAYGRSIFTGKIDLFDDLDQCLSQNSNAIRRSTVTEYYNSDYLERDENTGMPKQPKAYDRKYVIYKGQTDANGASTSREPVQVTQPQINFAQYTDNAVQILVQICNGILSPATLGIDLAKKDNAMAQREKEKVTIFTRNGIIASETEILRGLCSQLLTAYFLMHNTDKPVQDFSISIKFSEFADESYENKLKILCQAYDGENISDEMYMEKLYGDTLSEEEYNKELAWLKENHTEPKKEGMLGAGAGAKQGEINKLAQKNIEVQQEQQGGVVEDDDEEEL
jgi:hypothetical protein